jgi:hypothetical protein
MEKYNSKCNKLFTSDINHKYNISFYNNDDNKNFIILRNPENNNLITWVDYKVLCSYHLKYNYLLDAKNMSLVEDKIKDTKFLIKDKINNVDELEQYIMKHLFDYDYIGYVVKRKGDVNYYFLINKIIRL